MHHPLDHYAGFTSCEKLTSKEPDASNVRQLTHTQCIKIAQFRTACAPLCGSMRILRQVVAILENQPMKIGRLGRLLLACNPCQPSPLVRLRETSWADSWPRAKFRRKARCIKLSTFPLLDFGPGASAYTGLMDHTDVFLER